MRRACEMTTNSANSGGSKIGLMTRSLPPMSLTQIRPDRIATQSERATNSSVPIMASISIISATSTPWVWK